MLDQKSKELVYFKVPTFIVDLCIHLSVLFLTVRTWGTPDLWESDGTVFSGFYVCLALAYAISIYYIGLRLHERSIKLSLVIWRGVKQTALTYAIFVVLVAFLYKISPRHIVLIQFLITMPLIILMHVVINKSVLRLRKNGHNIRTAVIIGADAVASQLYGEMKAGKGLAGYKVLGYFSSLENVSFDEDATYLGKVKEFKDWIKEHHTNEVYCTLPPAMCEKEVADIIQICNDNFIEFNFVPTMDGYPKHKLLFENFGKVTVIKLREEPLNTLRALLFKRTMDILISGLFLCTVYPFVFLFVWLGDILTGSKGPVYFMQARTGYNGKSFMIYKFRSMKVNADADKVQATKDDPRKTIFGNFLRKTSIDELPQFINVLKGDMSIIGPRPHMEFHTEMYSALINDYMLRHLAKPGITGWAQINGCRGETKTVEEMANRVTHDIWYIEHWTPLLDIEIFIKTFWQVLPGHDKQAY